MARTDTGNKINTLNTEFRIGLANKVKHNNKLCQLSQQPVI